MPIKSTLFDRLTAAAAAFAMSLVLISGTVTMPSAAAPATSTFVGEIA